jgi:hypothetical protein
MWYVCLGVCICPSLHQLKIEGGMMEDGSSTGRQLNIFSTTRYSTVM